jgi:glycosyltransferase involved in cell wall biosynthesis
LGALDWFPNQEAVKWLLDNVWPQLHKEFPNLKFYIAGRRPPQWMQDINIDGVEIIGEVENAALFIKSKAIMPVPLFSGSGMRVKIIEAMMLNKAVVTTSIGIEGIIHKDNENVLIANTADEFIAGIRKLIINKKFYLQLCENAQRDVQKYYSQTALTNKLIGFVKKL